MKELSKPDSDFITQLSDELIIEPGFIEKDWYVVQILNILKDLEIKGIDFIFAGGTCLAKAYKVIERFSEDIDFKINAEIIRIISGREAVKAEREYYLLGEKKLKHRLIHLRQS